MPVRRLQFRANDVRLTKLLEGALERRLIRQPRGLVPGRGVEQVFAQLLAHVLA